MRGQALAIAAVIVSGVATLVMSLSAYDSLYSTQQTYYRDYRFAEVFARLKRAPERTAARIGSIPGVDDVETRVVADANLEVEGFTDPIVARLVSLPDTGQPAVNRIYVRRGRLFDPARSDEVLVSEAFARAHGLTPGDRLTVTIKGRRERMRIVGIALSPEYMYQIAPGAIFPDPQRYGVLWMARTPLATAYDMEGAFNDVALTLGAGARAEAVIDRLDLILARYGGLGAYPREDQFSNRFLTEELKGLQTLAGVFPLIFMGVGAFLLNVVVSRLISTEREQIATLKAFGYANRDVGTHYLTMAMLIVLLGVAGGVALGLWLGRQLADIYTELYHFPFLHYGVRPGVILAGALISAGAAGAGTLNAVLRAVRLPPAEGMRPEAPAVYRPTFVERMGLQRWFLQPSRMILRNIERRPLKSLLSVVGIAFACGIMVVGNFQKDSIRYMVDVQYGLSQRQDLTVNFFETTSAHALHELRGLRGVEHVEGFRAVPARLRFEHRSYRGSVQGIEPGGHLLRPLDADLNRIELPPDGVVLTDQLAEILGIGQGERLIVEVLEGARPTLQVPVAAVTKEYLGVSAYMRRTTLNRLMGEGDALSGAYLAVDPREREAVFDALKGRPRVANTIVRETAIQSFYDTLAETILFYTAIATLLGASIAFGVVYNSARIALSERGRELASLRVLGFTHGEISYILLGELVVLTLAAIPPGFAVGWALSAYIAAQFTSDLYRVPLILEPDTYAFAALVVLISTGVSSIIVWQRLKHLDLIGVLKTRE